MKGFIFTFILLIGFLFVSVAEAKTDIQTNEGYELSINTIDFDLVVELQSIELQSITIQNTIQSQVFIIAVTKIYRRRATYQKENPENLRCLSNPGKFTNLAYNYLNIAPAQVKYKIPFGLRTHNVNSPIV